jgi:AraC-like DNA-binding protein
VEELFSQIADWPSFAHGSDYCCKTMAEKSGLSLRQFERRFRQEFGTSPKQWIKVLRMNIGRTLIANGGSTKEAGIELKFCNTAHFCHEFRNYWRHSPQYYSPRSETVS